MNMTRVLFILLFSMVVLSSCGAVETIFKAGMWWAFFLVIVAIVIVIIIVSKVKK
jgi:hypothetical protein